MKVTVGLVGHGVMSEEYVDDADGKPVKRSVFHAGTATIYIDRGKDTLNMHEGNYVSVALAIARKRLQTEVFPVWIEKPDWLPPRPVKHGHKPEVK